MKLLQLTNAFDVNSLITNHEWERQEILEQFNYFGDEQNFQNL